MSDEKFPELSFRKGTSGLEIAAVPGFEANMVEFTLKANVPQAVFISPWIQFEDPKFSEWRTKIAMEIIRRAMGHDALVKECQRLKESNDNLFNRIDALMNPTPTEEK